MCTLTLRVLSFTISTSSIELVELIEIDRSELDFPEARLSLRDLFLGVDELLFLFRFLGVDDLDLDLEESGYGDESRLLLLDDFLSFLDFFLP